MDWLWIVLAVALVIGAFVFPAFSGYMGGSSRRTRR
jgi:hypothetical protein